MGMGRPHRLRLLCLLMLGLRGAGALRICSPAAPASATAAAFSRARVQMLAPPPVSLPPLLLAEDQFGQVFLAGMSIALASIGSTVLVGFLVRNKFDEIESSYFEKQDEDVAQERAKTRIVSDEVRDFFGSDIDPVEAPGEVGEAQ